VWCGGVGCVGVSDVGMWGGGGLGAWLLECEGLEVGIAEVWAVGSVGVWGVAMSGWWGCRRLKAGVLGVW
jgi:hypothetical protein